MGLDDKNLVSLCHCDMYPPTDRKLVSVTFLAALAQDLWEDDLSIPQILYEAMEEILSYHTGKLYDRKKWVIVDGKRVKKNLPFNFDAEYKDGLDVIEWALGADWGRGTRRFLERRNTKFVNNAKATDRLLTRHLLLHYMREIRACRTSGQCSQCRSATE